MRSVMQALADRAREGSEEGKVMEVFLPLSLRVSTTFCSSPHPLHPPRTGTCSAGVFSSWPRGSPRSGARGENARQDPGSHQHMSSDQRALGWGSGPTGQPDSRTVTIISLVHRGWPPANRGQPLPNICPARVLGSKATAEWAPLV